MIYLIGSLRNPKVSEVARVLRNYDHEVFDEWSASGPEADDIFYSYAKSRGWSSKTALQSAFARSCFNLDKHHIDTADVVVLVLPAGKSAHLELGYALGQGKRGYILQDGEPERIDMMYQFATGIVSSIDELVTELRKS